MGLRGTFRQLGNGFISLVLRSPVHGLVSKRILLITVKGRRSGKKFTTPVNYLRNGEVLTIVSLRQRTWWRNLRGGSEVALRLRGREVFGKGEVVEEEGGVAQALTAYFQRAPNDARYFHVALDDDGNPNDVDVEREARSRVVIQVRLT